MTKKTILTSLALLFTLGVTANPISRQQARQQAAQFVTERGKVLAEQSFHRAAKRAAATEQENDYYYVFNTENNRGYVIVSGDDRTASVLGYVDQGSFDENTIPDGLRWMLQCYREQMDQLDGVFTAHAAKRAAAANEQKLYSRPTRHNIEPLLPMLWNQGEPYNLLCPRYYNEDGTLGGLSATGCVATALAQVVGYYRWPEKLKRTIPGYVQKYSTSQGEKSVRINSIPAGSVIDWDNILNNYYGSETEAQKTAIAQLMYWVGVDCKMSYGASSASGYSEGVDGLINYFDFDDGTHVEKRGNYTLQGWTDLVYNEIATGHPVPFGGQNSGGGHAFVLDGYDVSGLYHVNWGWGGMANGYFRIDILDPDNTSGIGASQTPGGYNMGQDCIIGMKRPDGVKDTPPSRYKLSANDWQIRGTDRFFANYVNWSGISATWNYGIGYQDENGELKVVGNYSTSQISPNYYVGMEFTVRGLSKGVYRIVPISKRSTDAKWNTDVCPDLNYIYTEVNEAGQVVKMEIRPTDNIEMPTISFPGNHKRGDNQTVSATFHNNGEDEFFKEIHLFASQTNDKGSAICRTAIAVRPGSEETIGLVFKPEQNGTWNIWLATDNRGENVVGQGTLEVTETGVAPNQNLRYLSHTVTNKSNNMIYGNRMQGVVTVQNQGTEPYNGTLKLTIWKLNGGYYWSDKSTTVSISVEPNKTGKATYNFENLELNATYAVNFSYGQGGEIDNGGLKDMGRTQAGVVYWQSNQTLMGMGASATVTTPSGAVAIDMTGLTNTVKTVRPNSNKNTLYIFGVNDQIPEGLEECNVVKGSKAEHITMKDSLNFFSPVAFTAGEVNYIRTFAKDSWETIALPFAPQQLPENTVVKSFSALESDDTAVFTAVEEMERNVPYLIKVKDGGQQQLKASDVLIASTTAAPIKIGVDDFWFCGNTLFTSLTKVLKMNDDATAFEPVSTLRLTPFRAYFLAPEGVEKIEIGGGDINGIEGVKHHQQANGVVYDLQGRQVKHLKKGIYIVNGKKIVK